MYMHCPSRLDTLIEISISLGGTSHASDSRASGQLVEGSCTSPVSYVLRP